MRVFVRYAPMQIAKHVAAFFKGTFEIADLGTGTFVFDGGKVVINERSGEEERRIGKEVNRLIAAMVARSRRSEGYC